MKPTGNGALRGYRRKPLAITVFALLFLSLPLLLVWQLWAQADGSWAVVRPILQSRYFLQEWCLAWSAALAVWIVSRGSFLSLVVLSGYVLTTRLSHWVTHPELETPIGIVITVIWLGTALALLGSSLRTPYLNPRLRWWTRPPRVAVACEAMLKTAEAAWPIDVLNVSEGGMFVKLAGPVAAQSPLPLRLGDRVTLAMTLRHSRPAGGRALHVTTAAQLVWQGQPEGPYRAGFGVKFLGLSRRQRQQLKRFLRDEARLSA